MRQAARGVKPTLVLVTGPSATGKSTLAEAAAETLVAPVFAWDWIMAGLTPFETLQRALRRLDSNTYRSVGWSLLWQLATAQLRAERSAVLDGVARQDEVARTRALADEYGARCIVALTSCEAESRHRSMVEGRKRGIPGWHELDWDHVARVRRDWNAPTDVDLALDASVGVDTNVGRLRAVLNTA